GVDKTVWLWDARTGALLYELKGRTDGVSGVQFSPDGTHLAIWYGDQHPRNYRNYPPTVGLWDARTGVLLHELKGQRTSAPFGWASPTFAFSPDGSCLATQSQDKSVRLWAARTGKLVRELEGH